MKGEAPSRFQMKRTRQSTWRCDKCGAKSDTLYFCGDMEICERCREDSRRASAIQEMPVARTSRPKPVPSPAPKNLLRHR